MKGAKIITEYAYQGEKEGATISLMAIRLSPQEHTKALEEFQSYTMHHIISVDADSIVGEIRAADENGLSDLLENGWTFHDEVVGA